MLQPVRQASSRPAANEIASGEIGPSPAGSKRLSWTRIRMARSSSSVFRAILPSIRDVAADDLHRFARQSDHPLHIGLRRLAREMEDGHLPSPWGTEFVEELLDQYPVAVALDGRQTVQLVLGRSSGRPAAADAPPRRCRSEDEADNWGTQLPMPCPSSVGAIDPVGTTYASAENVARTITPRQSTTIRSTVWRTTPSPGFSI